MKLFKFIVQNLVRHAHIDANEIEKVNKILNEKRNWYDQTVSHFGALKSHEDSIVLCSHIKQEQVVSVLTIV
jgi:hypothetical protein